MSIDPDDPAHFVRRAGVDPGAFVPRSRYGDYLSEALRSVDGLGGLTVHRGRVARIFEASGGGLTVLLADDVVIPAAKVVLAVGNQAPVTACSRESMPGPSLPLWKSPGQQHFPG